MHHPHARIPEEPKQETKTKEPGCRRRHACFPRPLRPPPKPFWQELDMEFWDDLPIPSPPDKKCRVAVSTTGVINGFPEGAGGHSDALHMKTCRATACSRCSWIRNKEKWSKICGPWLGARLDLERQTFGVGCSWCSEGLQSKAVQSVGLGAARNMGFAKFEITGEGAPLKLQRLQKHATTPGHLAVASLRDGCHVPEDQAMPPRSDWAAVMDATLTGNATSIDGLPGRFGGKKMRKMQFCLADAKRDITTRHLMDAVTVAISQDVRKTRYLLRYKLALPNLEVHTGVLDVRREVSDGVLNGADLLRRAALRSMEQVCTPRQAPGVNGSTPELDRSMLDVLISKIEMVTADGASDEQLACRELSGTLHGGSVTEIRDVIVKSLPALKAPSGFVEMRTPPPPDGCDGENGDDDGDDCSCCRSSFLARQLVWGGGLAPLRGARSAL